MSEIGQLSPISARVTGVILAAGPSTRFGGEKPKQLFRIDGEPMVRRVARAALDSELHQILVVVGHQSESIGAILAGLAVEVVDNPDYLEGQSTSVLAGLSQVEPSADSAMFIPCDQPFLTGALINQLIDRFAATGGPIVVPTVEGSRRAPVLIARTLFAELSTIRGDEGGRQIFAAHKDNIIEVALDDDRAVRDLDCESDLQTELRKE